MSRLLPVYIIHWDAPDWCRSAVNSLGHSRGLQPLLTVVDNGQSSGTPLKELLPADVRVLATPQNLGYAGAANLALADWQATFSSAEFCVIASHDLHTEADTLSGLVAAARCRPEFGVLGPGITAPVRSSGGRWTGSGVATEPLGAAVGLVERDWVSGTCMLIRRECAEAVGGFDPDFGSYGEDVDFCLRAGDAGWRVGVVRHALARGLGSVSPEQAWTLIEANTVLLVAKRHGRRAGVRALGRLLILLGRATGGRFACWRATSRRAASRTCAAGRARALRLILARRCGWTLPVPGDGT